MAASEENEPVMAISARIEIVQSSDLLDEPTPTRRRDPRTLPRDRQIAGLVRARLQEGSGPLGTSYHLHP